MARLDPAAGTPWWAARSAFVSVTRTPTETSVVCESAGVPTDVRAERGFVAYMMSGPIPFEATGVLHSVIGPLAVEGISCFPLSTFDTDYVLIRLEDESRAVAAWRQSGHLTPP